MDQGVISSVAAAALGVTILGVPTGLTYDVLLAGFAGGLVSLSYIGKMGWAQRFWALLTSTITAGYTAPVVLAILAKWLDLGNLPASGLMVAGFITGLAAQTAIPMFLTFIRTFRKPPQQDITP